MSKLIDQFNDLPLLAKLSLAAGAGALISAGALLTGQYVSKRRRILSYKDEIRSSMSDLSTVPVTLSSTRAQLPEELVREQLSRNYSFLGEEVRHFNLIVLIVGKQGMAKVRNAFVIVVGVGGVGSHAAHMLVRSGIQHIRVIDFDQITLSSLNRHAVATHADVGTPKVVCLASHFKKIAPNTKVETEMELFDIAAAPRLLSGKPDFVLDCIDNIQTKLDLIAYCHANKIRILASMGAGAKADPSCIQLADISDTFEDPLARVTRKGLKMRGIDGGVPVVYSTEKPGAVKLLPMAEEKVSNAEDFAVLPNFRSRILPVLGTIPAMFGMAMASFVVTEIAGHKLEPLAVKRRTKVYERILKDIKMQGTNQSKDEIKITTDDVGFLLEEIWRGKSAVSGSLERDKVTLTRWDTTKPYEFGNLICLTKAEADVHYKSNPDQVASLYDTKIVKFIEQKLAEELEALKWRR